MFDENKFVLLMVKR